MRNLQFVSLKRFDLVEGSNSRTDENANQHQSSDLREGP